jgi:hypothetical protein
MRHLSFSWVVGAILVAAACNDSPGNGGGLLIGSGTPPPLPESTPVEVKSRLWPLTSCADVEATLRQGAIEAMNKRLDAMLRGALTDDQRSCRPNGHLFDRYYFG